jgi:ATP-dependent DNA helicase RecG
MTKIYEFIRKECLDGKQCIIVFPLIEESEKLDLEDAINAYEKLKNNVFKDLKVGLVHGKINADKKEKILKQFIENKVKILVSTTVIEVGIDVPNATVMLIENAERFGLTQLHQLRGRVGRGLHQSYCILVKRNVKDTSLTRLKALEETNDGFKLADKDLELRGPGEFFGLRQSGFLNFKIADLVKDKAIIQIARKTAIKTVLNDPSLKQSFNRGLRRHLFDTYPKELSDFNI